MAETRFWLEDSSQSRVYSFGTTASSGEGLLTINNGAAALSNVVLDVKGSQSIAGDLNLLGSLNITGDINRSSVTELTVTDLNITLNNGGTTAGAANSGIFVEGDSNSTIGKLLFDNSLTSKWKIGDGTTQVEVVTVSGAQTLTNKSISGSQITGNIAGNAANVTGTVAVANGGTGATTLTGYLKGNGTGAFTASATIAAADISGNISGNAANVTGTVAIANGGTGETTLQGAINATSPLTTLGDIVFRDANNTTRLAGNTTTTKQFLTQTGTGGTSAAPVWSAIGASDIPTLNQDTTGTAANVTGVVAVANGGTGKTSITTGSLLIGNGTSAPTELVGTTSGHVVTWNGSTFVVQAPTGTSAYAHWTTVSGTQDGVNKVFTIGNALAAGSEIVVIDGVTMDAGESNDYILSGTTLTIQANRVAPRSTSKIKVYGFY